MENAKDLENRQRKLKKRMLSTIVVKHSTESNKRFRVNGYLHDLRVNYSKEEFEFTPGEFILDQKDVLWICLGAGKAPDFGTGEVLWFLSEKDNFKYFDNSLLNNSQDSFVKVPSLIG
jgi:hypothetical protein